jgi:hypothetical protein
VSSVCTGMSVTASSPSICTRELFWANAPDHGLSRGRRRRRIHPLNNLSRRRSPPDSLNDIGRELELLNHRPHRSSRSHSRHAIIDAQGDAAGMHMLMRWSGGVRHVSARYMSGAWRNVSVKSRIPYHNARGRSRVRSMSVIADRERLPMRSRLAAGRASAAAWPSIAQVHEKDCRSGDRVYEVPSAQEFPLPLHHHWGRLIP